MKLTILFIAKVLGLFEIASWLTRNRIRILGYHGIWFLDDHFGNFLYMDPEKFQARMTWLEQSKYSIISLGKAVDALHAKKTTPYSIVITIDDGWYGTYKYMLPVLEQKSLPATLYVYTEAVESQKPLFHILISAIFQLSNKTALKTDSTDVDSNKKFDVDISSPSKKQEALSDILRKLHTLDNAQAEEFCRDITVALGFDYESILESRQFSLMTFDEIQKANQRGLDIQLHTHTHHVDIDAPEKIVDEITINRKKLEPHVTSSLEHFCYPSGIHSLEMQRYLETNAVVSGTLCDTGLVTSGANLFELNRILDGQQVSQLEFEGEISGFLELTREMRNKFKRLIAS
ncbi:polysaccharide deacetylase family protein [Nitrosomonas sp.]|uniref:polysaccharide deacetylase family protein n=1 Tax=Nitrosomonas sp. TaxID=42353 RepID=UPI00208C9843|nr:polysaccharide deacetylase family protein [Nitrosomonas sp.]GJL74783.1 MAG: hypothetical protein NMNS02_08890 [Nitrosomonas sp.]